jgi:thiol-disulfide isomerase/thioredoxin
MKRLSTILLFLSVFTYGATGQQKENKTDFSNAIKSETDPFIKENYLLQMDSSSPMYEYSTSLIISAFAEIGNVEKVNYWINSIKKEDSKYLAIYTAIYSYTSENRLKEAENLILPIINAGKGKTYRTSSGTNLDFEFLYGLILYKKGNYDEVLQYWTPLIPKSMHEMYAIAMAKAGDPKQALAEIKTELMKPGDKEEIFTKTARELFAKIYGNDSYYKKYIDSANVVKEKLLLEKVTAKMINIPSPDFNISDVKGKSISLKSLAGKTVVIDFWATWCQPCVGSFPAMQKLVNYFSKDSSVVFMFIHTSDRSSNATAEAKKLISSKHYTFDLYMDLRDPSTKKNPLATIFGISFLPTKLIIDKTGNIRFKDTGYIDEYEGFEEVKMMIEQVKKQ